MMSAEVSTENCLAGRQPAVKAGGMRIKSSRHHEVTTSSKQQQQSTDDDVSTNDVSTDVNVVKEEGKSSVQTKEEAPQQQISSNNIEYSSKGVKLAHNKPYYPTHEKPIMNKQINKTIQQPR